VDTGDITLGTSPVYASDIPRVLKLSFLPASVLPS